MKISKLRRTLAVLLSAAMLIMSMPLIGITAAAAVEDTTSCEYTTVDGEEISTLSEVDEGAAWETGTLTEALAVANAAHDGQTVYIKLLSDVTGDNYGKTINLSASKGNTVFDLNGQSVDGNNAYRCVYVTAGETLTITSSASDRGTITNGYSAYSDGGGGVRQDGGTLTLSNVNVTNNILAAFYGAGITALEGTRIILSNVKITGNQSTNTRFTDAYPGGLMTYIPFTFKDQVEITGNSNAASSDRDFRIVSGGENSSVSGLTAGSDIKLFNKNGAVTLSGDGGDNTDIYGYFSLTDTSFWLAPTATGGIQVTKSLYGVIFDMQGTTDNIIQTVSGGGKATKPTDPAVNGYEFLGWYTDTTYTTEFDFDNTTISSNTTIYAKWLRLHDHDWSYSANENVITAHCAADGCDITADPTLTLTAADADYTGVAYTGADVTTDTDFPVTPVVTYVGIDGTAYSGSTTAPTAAGKYTVSASVDEGNTAVSADFEIKPIALTENGVTVDPTGFTYDGSEKAPAVTVKAAVNGLQTTLTADTDYTVSGDTSATNASTGDGYEITVTGIGNFSGEISKLWTIGKAVMTGVSADDVSETYDAETSYAISVTGAPAGSTIYYGTSADTCTSTENISYTDAGTYTVYYKVTNPNYEDFTGSADINIAKAAYNGTKSANGNILAGIAQTDVTVTLPEIPENMACGTPVYSAPVTAASVADGALKFSTDNTAADGQPYTVTIPVNGETGANYNDYIITVTLAANNCTHPDSYTAEWSSDEDGHWHVCPDCHLNVDISEHTEGTPVKENVVEATCTTDGSYDEVVYCAVCEAELSRTPKTITAEGHKWSEAFESDKDGHWHKCEVCEATTEKEAHVSGGAATTEHAEACTVCGYEIAPKLGQVAAPVITPNGGTFIGWQEVTITCATEGAKIYYTTNGSDPTANSALYEGKITIDATTTIKAIAIKEGVVDSSIVSADFKKDPFGIISGPSIPSRPSSSDTPTAPTSPAPTVDGSEKSWSEVAGEISGNTNPENNEYTINLNGTTKIPAEVIKAIAETGSTVTFVSDSMFRWVVDGTEVTAFVDADLTIDRIANNNEAPRGTVGTAFTINDTGIPTSLEISFKATHSDKIANLYKAVGGKLMFVTCAKIGADGRVILPDVTDKGNYVTMLCELSDRPGDMNNDCVMNAADAAAILKYILGHETGANPLMADLNGDSRIDSEDATEILKRIVGLA